MTNSTLPHLLQSKVPAVGDILLNVDNTPISAYSLVDVLHQMGTTAVLPIIDSTHPRSSNDGTTIDPGFRIKGFVRIETFMPSEMELQPGFPARIQAFETQAVQLLAEQHMAQEHAKVQAETLALNAAKAKTLLDQQKHELAVQESKRKLMEEGKRCVLLWRR